MGVVHYLRDGLRNLVANLQTERDKVSHSTYEPPSLTPEELLNAYRGAWLPRKIVDIPALDATRKWRTWQAEKEQISAIEREERRHALREKTNQALTAARLYGGAALYIATTDRNTAEPLDLNRIGAGDLERVVVLTCRHLTPGEIDLDPWSDWFNRPAYWTLSNGRDGEQVRVHPSRLAIFEGLPLPEDGVSRSQGMGWGDSVLLPTMDAVKHADGTSANVASLVYEAKIDVIRIPDFMANLADPRYREKVIERAGLAAMAKGINGSLLLDKEEEYDQKSASFATLPEIMDRFYQAVSGAADIPMTRLFGQSPAGLNATGESDLRNYYDRIQAMQEVEMTPAMWRLDEAVIRSAIGSRPEEIFYTWASLWQSTDKERAEIGKITAETAKTLAEAKLWPEETLSKAAANAMIETGALPGLEAAIEEFGSEPPEDDPDEVAAAAMAPPPRRETADVP